MVVGLWWAAREAKDHSEHIVQEASVNIAGRAIAACDVALLARLQPLAAPRKPTRYDRRIVRRQAGTRTQPYGDMAGMSIRRGHCTRGELLQ
eukprot:SAG31_NODE_4982_length_2820_cov_3.084160_5_plen_92_part_00